MTTTAPRVSLITPAYNQADYLAETIDSVLAQRFTGLEYVVVDDGSTDHTPDVLARYAGRISWRRQPNQGQARTLNLAWAQARGEYLGYLSSDDVLRPEAIGRLADYLDAHPEAVCVFPNSDLIDANSRCLRRRICKPFDLVTTLVSQECHIGPGALFRRSALEAVGGWHEDLRLAPDREFWMRIALRGEIHMLDEDLALYRMHAMANSFQAATAEGSREYLRVLDRFFARGDLPDALRQRQSEARGRATLLMARNALWRGEWSLAWTLFDEARHEYAPLGAWTERLKLLRQGVSKPIKHAYERFTRFVARAA